MTQDPKRFTLDLIAKLAIDNLLQFNYHPGILVVYGANPDAFPAFLLMKPDTTIPMEQKAAFTDAGKTLKEKVGATWGDLDIIFFVVTGQVALIQNGPFADVIETEALVCTELDVQGNRGACLAYSLHRDSDGNLEEIKPLENVKQDPSTFMWVQAVAEGYQQAG